MNRIFHARVAIGQYLFLLLATAVTLHEMWMRHAVLTVLFMLLLVVAIERLIHTTYTLTADGRLVLYFGRFTRPKEIPLQASPRKIGGFAIMHYVLVKYGAKEKCVVLLPVKEELFVKMLQERMGEERAADLD